MTFSLRCLPALLIPLSILQAQDFTGRVVQDSTGDPVATAEIKVHKPGMRELIADLETDRQGNFSGSGLPPGDYAIDVLKPNFLTTTFPIRLPASSIQIRLLHFAVMDGNVINAQGEPVAGIVRASWGQTIGATRVTVLTKQPVSEEWRSVKDVALDAKGHFRFFDLPPGQYQLGMWFYGINEGSGMQLYRDNAHPRIFTVAGGEVYNNLNFLIPPNPSYKISGSIALPEPKQKFALALGLPDQPLLPVSIALSDDDGTFHFDKVPTGTYDLFVAGPTAGYGQFESVLKDKGQLYGRMRIQVAASDIAGVAVPLMPAKSLTVILRPHGGNAFPAGCPQTAGLTVTPLEPWGVQFGGRATVSAGKEQTIPEIPPGRVRLSATGLGPDCFQAEDIAVDLSKDVAQPVAVQVAAAGSIRGTLPPNIVPSAYAIILLDAGSSQGTSRLAYPDANRQFTFRGLRPGRYRIAAQPSGGAPGKRWVANFAEMKEINVTAGAPVTIDLPVTTPQGGVQ